MDFFSKYKFSIWIVLALIVLNIATLIFMWVTIGSSQRYPMPPPPHGHDRMSVFDQMKRELGLDKEQIVKFDVVTKKHLDEMKALRDSIQLYKDKIIDESFSSNADIAQTDFLSSKIGQFQAEIEKSISQHFIGVNKICTPEQTQELKDLFGKIRQKPFGGEPPPRPKQ